MKQRMDAIIFGSNGQDGKYLKMLLEKLGKRIVCISRSGEGIAGDIRDYTFVEEQIKNHQPKYIFNFAAVSSTKHSALFENHETISRGTLNVHESVRLHCPDARIFNSGSAMQFYNDGSPINEQTPFEASSPYAVARIHSAYLSRYYRKAFGLQTYVGYLFHHDSPFRSERHINQKIVQTIKRIRDGHEETLELGNIDVQKEFNYALDIVEAIWILVNQSEVYEVVIGSGETHSIKEWIQYCFGTIGRNWEDSVRINDKFVPDFKILVSNPFVMKSLGWSPTIGFHHLADLMMNGTSGKR
jgi:GDPmannose 4,6-dehydratase